jgi:Protein of unknown function (DUF1552)
MMFITKKHLSRRTFLRGAGVTIALPFLESMVPAQTALSKTAANPKSRLACIYMPHGATMDHWTPATEGTGFEFSEILKPLEPFREYVNVVSGLCHPQAGPTDGEDSGGALDHNRAVAVFITGAHPKKGAQSHVGVSLDQVVAENIGQDTPLPSIELSIEESSLGSDAGFSGAYRNTISWKSPTVPLPMEHSPQVAFERLFGDGSTDVQRKARREQSISLLDSVSNQVASLQKELPAADRTRLSQYLEEVREIERRIAKAAKQTKTDVPLPEAPVGIPDDFEEHLKLMWDLQALAYQAEITRISTLLYSHETSGTIYPKSGVREGFHNASHHSNNRKNMDQFAVLNRYHIGTLTYFFDKLKQTPDGDGNLLDHSLILYGSTLSDGNEHNHDPLPVLLIGRASGLLKGGRHLSYPAHTPMSNLLLTILNKFGIQQDKFGDSTGNLEI